MRIALFSIALIFTACFNGIDSAPPVRKHLVYNATAADSASWGFFLSHIPILSKPVLDFRGRTLPDQRKAAGILPFDVGTSDLQQCADALMRLRAEYLFGRNQADSVGFHFVSGQFYRFRDYCSGKRPVAAGNSVRFIQVAPSPVDHASLRRYLDIVYTYASTISLAKELRKASTFKIGTVIIHPGSPGHCFIIIDEKLGDSGEKLFKLAEGYTPAQSIYVLRNAADGSVWHSLTKGPISTASYYFADYQMGSFE